MLRLTRLTGGMSKVELRLEPGMFPSQTAVLALMDVVGGFTHTDLLMVRVGWDRPSYGT